MEPLARNITTRERSDRSPPPAVTGYRSRKMRVREYPKEETVFAQKPYILFGLSIFRCYHPLILRRSLCIRWASLASLRPVRAKTFDLCTRRRHSQPIGSLELFPRR